MKFNKLFKILLESNATSEHGIRHIEHLEDFILINGKDGIELFTNIINDLLNKQKVDSGEVDLGFKADGAVAVIFGKDPVDNKFFLSTKAALSKTPKLVKNVDEVDKYWTEKPDLVEKLKTSFIYLSKLTIDNNTAYHGDVLFTEKEKKQENIDGASYITFTPNTITYAINSSNTELFNLVARSKFGIAIHTKYNIERHDANSPLIVKEAKMDEEIVKQFNTPEIFAVGTKLKTQSLQFEDNESIQKLLTQVNGRKEKIDAIFRRMTDFSKSFTERLRVFVNSNLDMPDFGIFGKAIRKEQFDGNKLITDLKAYLEKYFANENSKTQDEKRKSTNEANKGKWVAFIDTNANDIKLYFETFFMMINIKDLIYKDIDKFDSNLGETFVKEGLDFRKTGGEGFVIMIKPNVITKIINRTEFARLNRQLSKNKKKNPPV